GRLTKAWRWAQRHPIVAASLATVAAALVAVTALAVLVARSERVAADAERDRAKALRENALKEKQRLRQALLGQARAERLAGNRWRALELLREAAASEAGDDLRQEAILALATPGLRLVGEELIDDAEPLFEMTVAAAGQQPRRMTQQEWLLKRI